MAKTQKIQIHLKIIIDNFETVKARRYYGACQYKRSSYKWGGKFLVADMPYGEFVFSSLN